MSEPFSLGAGLFRPRGRSGRWFRRGGNIVIDLGGRDSSSQGELQEEISEEVSSPNAVIDPRIDVHAQFAIQRLSRNPATARAAAAMLAAVKSGEIGGIYKEDQKVPALLARRFGLGWWQILSPGDDAALVIDPDPPILVFRDKVRSNPARLDPALVRASRGLNLVILSDAATGEQQEAPALAKPFWQRVIQPRIDVEAQKALIRMNNGGDPDAAFLISLYERGDLYGIFKPDQKEPALLIRQLCGNWWEYLEGGIPGRLLCHSRGRIMLVFRKTLTQPELITLLKELAAAFRSIAGQIPCADGAQCL